MWRVKRVNDLVKEHDRELFAKKENGVIQVFRKTREYVPYSDHDLSFTYTRYSPYFVLALTDTWNMNGKPVDWGLEPISKKLKEMDLWKRDNLANELIKSYERADETSKKDFRNKLEAKLKDDRRAFAKAFDGVNTSTLAKIDKRRFEDGNRK